MKQNAIASLAALALLSAGSLAYAAEVTGGNVAVVVQRASVPSASGYQLLCVPVKGLDITGSARATSLTLDQVLPPEAYGIQPTDEASIASTAQCKVTIFGTDTVTAKIKPTATTTEDVTTWSYAWTTEDGNTGKGTTPLACGTVLWFYNPADVNTGTSAGSIFGSTSAKVAAAAESSSSSQVTFCGQQNETQNPITSEGGKTTLQKIGNETSGDIALSTLFSDSTCAKGTQIFRIAAGGDANYTIYAKKTSSWTKYHPEGGLTANIDMTKEKLAPGEAIYYFAIAPQVQP